MNTSLTFNRTKGCKGKHSKTIETLINRLKTYGEYEKIEKNIEYRFKGSNNVLGEIDVFATRRINNKKYLILFEVKSNNTSYGRATAISQLRRQKENLRHLAHRIKTYYVYFDAFSKGFVHTEEIK